MGATVRGALLALACASACVVGCDSDDEIPEDAHGGAGSEAANAPPAPRGHASIARITRAFYANAVEDVLGITPVPASLLPEDGRDGSGRSATAAVTVPDVRAWLAASEWVAEQPGSEPALRALVSCAAAARGPFGDGERACVDKGVAALALRLFRRPSSTGRYVELYATRRREGADAIAAAKTVLVAILTSPSFLYVGELDRPGSSHPLDGYAVAARLAAFLWQSVPDEPLLGAARDGALTTREGVVAAARRMIGGAEGHDRRVVRGVRAFAHQWLSLDRAEARVKSTALYPEFDDRVRGSLASESELFVADVVLAGDGRYETLLTAPFAWVNAATAPLYRVSTHDLDGATFRRVPLDENERAGLLTQVGLLAMTGHAQAPSPTLRGRLVRERFLCESITAPPNGINIMPPVSDPTLSIREQYRSFMQNPACATCHVKMDPIGSGLLGFDTAGRRQTFENNLPIDEHGRIVGGGDAEGDFVGARGLAEKLAKSKTAQRCFAEQVVRFALQRAPAADEAATVTELTEGFAQGDHDIRELLVTVASSDFFRFGRETPATQER